MAINGAVGAQALPSLEKWDVVMRGGKDAQAQQAGDGNEQHKDKAHDGFFQCQFLVGWLLVVLELISTQICSVLFPGIAIYSIPCLIILFPSFHGVGYQR